MLFATLFKCRAQQWSFGVNQISAQFPGGSDLGASIQVRAPNGVPNFTADIESSISDFRSVLGWLDLAIPSVPADRLRKMSVRARIDGTPETIHVRDLDVYVDSSHLTGGITLAIRDRVVLGANLNLDRLNLDAYLGQTSDETSVAEAGDSANENSDEDKRGIGTNPLAIFAALNEVDAKIEARVRSLVYKSKPIRDLVLNSAFINGAIEIRRLSHWKVWEC